MLGGNERRPEGDAFGKRGTKCVAIIRPQSLPSAVFPENWILYYQVYKLIK